MRCTPSPPAPNAAEDAFEVDTHVVAVAAALQQRVGEITATMCAQITDAIDELADPRLLDLLTASVESNLATLLHLLEHGIPHSDVDASSAAVEHARRLAQHGVHVKALVRAYRIGQDHLLRRSYAEIERSVGNSRTAFHASQRFVSVTFAYVDRITEQLVAVHEAERERWLDGRSTLRATRVREIVEGRSLDVTSDERAIGYPLRQRHLGVVVWARDPVHDPHTLTRLEQFLGGLGQLSSCVGRPLFVARDHSTGWGWLPLGRAGSPPGRRSRGTGRTRHRT